MLSFSLQWGSGCTHPRADVEGVAQCRCLWPASSPAQLEVTALDPSPCRRGAFSRVFQPREHPQEIFSLLPSSGTPFASSLLSVVRNSLSFLTLFRSKLCSQSWFLVQRIAGLFRCVCPARAETRLVDAKCPKLEVKGWKIHVLRTVFVNG